MGSFRFAPASLLLAVTLAFVPMVIPGGLLDGGGPAAAAGHRPAPAAHTVRFTARSQTLTLRGAALVVRRRVAAHGVAAPSRAAESAPRQPAEDMHVVVAGDTLWAVARADNVTVTAIAAANGIAEDATLRLGQVLRVPGAQATARAPRVDAPQQPAPSREALASRVQFRWPASGIITSRFGWRIQPIFRTREFHTGLDIATRWGSPVLAARDGVVRFVGWQSGYGEMVVVAHDSGYETTYSHLSSAAVRAGDHVTQGELLGRIGNTGWSTGPHLLFEVRYHGVPQDPARYLH